MMDRRTFIQGAVASAALVLPMSQPLKRYKMGLQLYTMRAAMARDVAGTLSRISALGYQEVETYGFAPESLGYYGLSAEAFSQLLKDNKLTTSSGHYDLNRFASASDDDMKRYVDRCIAGAQALGQDYITWPLLDAPDRTIERFKAIAQRHGLLATFLLVTPAHARTAISPIALVTVGIIVHANSQ